MEQKAVSLNFNSKLRIRLVYNSLEPAPWLRACVARELMLSDKHSCDPLSSSIGRRMTASDGHGIILEAYIAHR